VVKTNLKDWVNLFKILSKYCEKSLTPVQMLTSVFGSDLNALDLAPTSLIAVGLCPLPGFHPQLQTPGSQVTKAGTKQAAPR